MTTARRPATRAAVLATADLATADPGISFAAPARLPLPAGVRPYQLNRPYMFVIRAYHAAALLAFMPGYFSWSGLVVALLGTHLCGLFGINLCYHRLLTHRGLKCPKWLEHAMVIVAMSCLQETPARWVAIHRRHHQFADEQPDPHSPLASFFWAHIGWILVDQPELPPARPPRKMAVTPYWWVVSISGFIVGAVGSVLLGTALRNAGATEHSTSVFDAASKSQGPLFVSGWACVGVGVATVLTGLVLAAPLRDYRPEVAIGPNGASVGLSGRF